MTRTTFQPPSPEAARRPRGRPRKTVDERDDGNRRQELIHAAAKLFHRKGFDATSTRDIAAAVGMRSGSPFYHFKSKGELLHAVMEEGMRSAIERQTLELQKTEQTTTDPRWVLAVLIRNQFDVLLGPGSDFIPVMLYESRALTAAPARQPGPAAARLRGGLDAGARSLARGRVVARGRQAGASADFWRAELVGAVVRPAQGRVN